MTYFLKIDEADNPTSFPIAEDNFRMLFPGMFPEKHIFFPSEVEPLGYGIFEFSQRPDANYPYKVVETTPEKHENGIYYQSWSIEEMTQAEKDDEAEKQADLVRQERNYKLFQSDWTILPFSPVPYENQLLWADYRQQLRDVTKQAGFPWEVVWPTEPSAT